MSALPGGKSFLENSKIKQQQSQQQHDPVSKTELKQATEMFRLQCLGKSEREIAREFKCSITMVRSRLSVIKEATEYALVSITEDRAAIDFYKTLNQMDFLIDMWFSVTTDSNHQIHDRTGASKEWRELSRARNSLVLSEAPMISYVIAQSRSKLIERHKELEHQKQEMQRQQIWKDEISGQ
jgi:hypothetical protein